MDITTKSYLFCITAGSQGITQVCVLNAVQRASHAARHSVHTQQTETHVVTTLQNL